MLRSMEIVLYNGRYCSIKINVVPYLERKLIFIFDLVRRLTTRLAGAAAVGLARLVES